MQGHDGIEQAVRAALVYDPRVNLHDSPIYIRRIENGTVLLVGEVANIETKRGAVDCASKIKGVTRVIDKLRLQQAQHLGDGAIRDSVCRRLFEESVFLRTALSCRVEGDTHVISLRPDDNDGYTIDASVAYGVVTLRGEVISLSHKRLAAVLAWWTPGCRDVVNELEIKPPEDDNDDEVSDAIRIVLDKDHLLHSDQIYVQVRDRQATLRGYVANENQKWLASRDAWYVDGVRNVINELQVVQPRTGNRA